MGLKSFFFPKDFKKSFDEGRYGGTGYMAVGSFKMKETQPQWWKFWSMMPIWGSIVFYRYGKKLVAEDKSGKLVKSVKMDAKRK
jgi:hypothetical protein